MKRNPLFKAALAAVALLASAQSYAKHYVSTWTDKMTDERKMCACVVSENAPGSTDLYIRFTMPAADCGAVAVEGTGIFLGNADDSKFPNEFAETQVRSGKESPAFLSCSRGSGGTTLFFDCPEELLKRIWRMQALLIRCQGKNLEFDMSGVADAIYNAGIRKAAKCLKPRDYTKPCRYCGKPRFTADHRIELSKCGFCSGQTRLCPSCLRGAPGVKATVKGFKLIKCMNCGAPAEWVSAE